MKIGIRKYETALIIADNDFTLTTSQGKSATHTSEVFEVECMSNGKWMISWGNISAIEPISAE
jgi:hypothetical protein